MAKVCKAQIATKVLFETGLQNVHANDIISALEGDPRLVFVERSEILEKPLDLLASVYGLLPSRSEFFFCNRRRFRLLFTGKLDEAQRLIAAKGMYLNDSIVNPKQVLSETDMLEGRVAVLRAGKNKHCILAIK